MAPQTATFLQLKRSRCLLYDIFPYSVRHLPLHGLTYLPFPDPFLFNEIPY